MRCRDGGESITTQHVSVEDPDVQTALAELEEMIRGRWPSATFGISRGEDNGEAIHLDATVDVDDTDQVVDVVIQRLLEMQLDGLPIHVIPTRPIERVAEELQRERSSGIRQRWGHPA